MNFLFLILLGYSIYQVFPASNPFPAAKCSEESLVCMSNAISSRNKSTSLSNSRCKCSKHAFCYLGTCMCHPGYDPASQCTKKMTRLNPWQPKSCIALHSAVTYAFNMSLSEIGGEFHRGGSLCPKYQKYCAYLCFVHITYGIAVVPKSLWLTAQKAESSLWKDQGRWATASVSNDRAVEHWGSFGNLDCLERSTNLGKTVEVGAGPWTQTKGFLYARPDLKIEHLTIVEPSANNYMAEVSSCSYRGGVSLRRWDGKGDHFFPVRVVSAGGESIPDHGSFDTLISINVLEHVQNAFEFLSQLYYALKPGGILIFHDRYYFNSHMLDGDVYHPIRIKRKVLDRFLLGFQIIYNNCSASYNDRIGEMGYYVIAKKL